jgi:hypothetical protein
LNEERATQIKRLEAQVNRMRTINLKVKLKDYGKTKEAGADKADKAPRKTQIMAAADSPVPKRKSKSSKKADAGKLKKPKNAYMLFCEEHRTRFIAEGLGFKEVGKALGKDWRALATGDKQRYNQLAAVEKKKYNALVLETAKAAVD